MSNEIGIKVSLGEYVHYILLGDNFLRLEVV